MTSRYYYPNQNPVGSRAHIALQQADLDASNASRGVPLSSLTRHPDPKRTQDFVSEIIRDNQDLWGKLLNHPFCLAMANAKASLDGFRHYMIQDMFFIRSYIKFRLRVFARADNWDDIKQAPKDIQEGIDYAEYLLNICTEQLGISEDVLGTPIDERTSAYNDMEYLAAIEEDWFSLHVLMLPCMVVGGLLPSNTISTLTSNFQKGYNEIAMKVEPNSVKESIYYRLWIKPNLDTATAEQYRDFCNQNMDAFPTEERRIRWKELFRSAREMEIEFFNTGLAAPNPYKTISPGIYVLRSYQTGTVVDLATAPGPTVQCDLINGRAYENRDTQKWTFSLTSSGYTIKNVAREIYIGLVSCGSDGDYTVGGLNTPEGWYILPAELSGVHRAYQLVATSSQGRVLDLRKGLLASGTPIYAQQNCSGANDQQGQDQAWIFDYVQGI